VRVLEAAAVVPALVENADEIDDRGRSPYQLRELIGIVDVGLDQIETRQHQQPTGPLAIARRYPDGVAEASETRREGAADETGAAEEADDASAPVSRH